MARFPSAGRPAAVVRHLARRVAMEEPRPHPENAPGDYFVEDGCCLTCEVPFHFAPDLFAWYLDPKGQPCHCFVMRQPETPDEHERMFEVIRHAEAGCI